MENQSEEMIKSKCGLKFHEFMTEVGDLLIVCHMIKMEDSLYVWVGNYNENAMNDLSFAIKSPYEKEPLATKIMGSIVNDCSSNLAKRLSKKLSMPVYISFNVQVDNFSLLTIERRLHNELISHPEIF